MAFPRILVFSLGFARLWKCHTPLIVREGAMPDSGLYQLAAAVIGIHEKTSACHTMMIPSGALIRVTGSTHRDGFLRCVWDGKDIAVLALDIRERAVRVSGLPLL